jgi:hypothetical protein
MGGFGSETFDKLNEQRKKKISKWIVAIDAMSNTTYMSYTPAGQEEKIWGATYPIWHEYDGYGRKVAMHTYRSGAGFEGSNWPAGAGAGDLTVWSYHEPSGLLVGKSDAAGKSVSYLAGGKLATRTWARQTPLPGGGGGGLPLITTYSYNPAGDLTGIDYSDGTPDVAFNLDRLGRQKTAASSASSHAFVYSGLLLDTETIISTAGTNIIDRSFDALGRPTGFTLGPTYSVFYGYDGLGRFSQISNVQCQVAYSYLPGSDLLAGYSEIKSGLVVEKTFETNRGDRGSAPEIELNRTKEYMSLSVTSWRNW